MWQSEKFYGMNGGNYNEEGNDKRRTLHDDDRNAGQ